MSSWVIKKKLYKSLFIFYFCFGGSYLAVAKTNTNPAASSSRVAVVVDKKIISANDLHQRLRLAALSSGLQDTADVLNKIRPALLRAMIDEQLQLQTAAQFNLEVSSADIQHAVENLEKANNMPPGALKKFLESRGIPFNVMETQLRANLLWVKYIQEKYIPSLQIRDQDIDQYLKRLQLNKDKTQYYLAEIVLYVENPKQEQSIKQHALELVKLLQQGAPFQGVAHQFSQAATSAQGGEIGWIVAEDLEKTLQTALAQQGVGKVSGPWRTAAGFTILFLVAKREPNKGEKLKLPSRDNVMRVLQSERLELFARQELLQLRSKAFIEVRQ